MRRSLVLLFPALALLPAGLAVAQDKGRGKSDRSPPAGVEKKLPPLFDAEAFIKEYDRNKDGYLTKDELPERFRHAFDRIDTNKGGKISKEEARGAIREHFKELDTNKDGFISRDELLEATMAGPPKAAKGSAASAGRREK